MAMPLLRLLLNLLSLAVSAAVVVVAVCAFRLLRDGPPWWLPLCDVEKRRRYHPIGGTLFHQLLNLPRLYDYHADLSRRYKTFRLLNVFHDEVYTTDPAVIEHVLRANAANYGKGDHTYEKLYDLVGDGIFGVDGDKWKVQRKFLSPEFSGKVLKTSSTDVFKANAARLAQLVSVAATNHDVIEMQDLFMRATIDSICENIAGVRLNRLLGTSEEGAAFAAAFDDVTGQIALRFVNPLWKVMRLLNIGYEATIKKNMQTVDQFLHNLIDAKARGLAGKQQEHGKKQDLLATLLGDMMNDPKGIDKKFLRDILVNLLLAGKDTTGDTLSWFFYMLCKNPLVQEKVFHDIKEATGSDANMTVNGFANNITEESLNRMQYLHAALMETLRLYPPVPLDAKVCFSDDILPDGFHVRKGDIVDYQPYPMGRMEHLWGKNAAVFMPERWLDEHGRFRPESPFNFTAFQVISSSTKSVTFDGDEKYVA